jgi:hypothetical protein
MDGRTDRAISLTVLAFGLGLAYGIAPNEPRLAPSGHVLTMTLERG